MAGTLGQNDLRDIRADAHLAEDEGEMFAQRRIPVRISVSDDVGTLMPRDRGDDPTHARLFEPTIRQPWAAREQEVLVGIE